MDVQLLESTAPGYMGRAQRIVDIYNDTHEMPGRLSLIKPQSTRIIHAEGDSGGLLLDHHPDISMWRIMFAAFDEENRGKGLIRKCLEKAKEEGLNITMVELDGSVSGTVWEHLGFTMFGNAGFTVMATSVEVPGVAYGFTARPKSPE